MKINWINFEFNLGQSLSEQKKTNPLNAVIGKIMHGCFSRNRDRIPEYVNSRSLGENKKWKTIKEFFKKILRKIASVFKRTPKVPKTNPSVHKANDKPSHIPAPPPPPPLFSKPPVPASVKNMHDELKKKVPETQPNTASTANPSARQNSIPTKTAPTPVQTKTNSTAGQTKPAPTTAQKTAPATTQPKPGPVPVQTKSTSADTTRPTPAAASQTTTVPSASQPKPPPTSTQAGSTSTAEQTTRPAPTTAQKTTVPSAAHTKPAPTTAKTMPAAQKIFQDKINIPSTAQATGNPVERKRQNSKLAAQWAKNVAQAAVTSSPPKEKIQVTKKDPLFLEALAAKVAKGGATPEKKGIEVEAAAASTSPPAVSNLAPQENVTSVPPQSETIASVAQMQPQPQPLKKSFTPQGLKIFPSKPSPAASTPHTPGSEGKRRPSIADEWHEKVRTPSSTEKSPVITTPKKINSALMGKIAGINFSPKGKPLTPPKPRNLEKEFEAAEEASKDKEALNDEGSNDKAAPEEKNWEENIPTAEEMEHLTTSCPEADFSQLLDSEDSLSKPLSKDDTYSPSKKDVSPRLVSMNKARALFPGRKRPTLRKREKKSDDVPAELVSNVESLAVFPEESKEPSPVENDKTPAEAEGSLKVLDSDGEKSSSEDDFVHVGSSPELSPTTTPRDDQKQEN